MNRQQVSVGCINIFNKISHKPYFVVEQSPETYETLVSSSITDLPIFGGASENTAYGLSSANHLMRAIHDSIHLELNADFTVLGEYRVAVEQCRLVGQWSTVLADILYADLRGQTLYAVKHGVFPVNQIDFVYAWFKNQSVEEVF